MIPQGSEWILHEGRHTYDGYFKLKEQASAVTTLVPQADHLHLYAKDSGTATELYYRNSDGTERRLDLSGMIIGGTISGATAGSVLFAGVAGVLQQDNANFFWDDTNNELRIGNITSADGTVTRRLQLHSDSTLSNGLGISASSAGATIGAEIQFLRSRGTLASKSIVLSGDSIGKLTWKAYDGVSTIYREAAQINGLVGGTPGSSDMPGALAFLTTPDGSVTLTEGMRLTQDQELMIGTSTRIEPTGATKLLIHRDNFAEIGFSASSATGNPSLSFYRSRGTLASPTIVSASDILGGYIARGWDGGAYRNCTRIHTIVDGTPGASDMPGAILFSTVPDGSITLTERLRIGASGDISHASGVRHRMLSQNRFRYLNILARGKRTTNQSISNATLTALSFDAEDFDTDTVHSTSTNPTRFTASITGKYLAVGGVHFDAPVAPGGIRLIRVRANGNTVVSASRQLPTSGEDELTASAIISLAATEYVEFIVYQDSGLALGAKFEVAEGGTATFGSLAYLGE